ncbi:hypothetical protein EES43_07260 [Streptomyces sp. ADI96-02]|uniref:DUF305 domain-containing protein n=1 Tax=Streptomyces sp. ADI96-02 TaxID=1522760 RepID=UPI000F96B15A|nr:DUF305 domain-containing protein [Streptomyces sp. ADI96-02]RPK65862.1 hypothetical protein EES43_07260 [Streptomyces sp. ADI96-02]
MTAVREAGRGPDEERRRTRRVRWAAGGAVALALLFAGAATVASARGGAEPGRGAVAGAPAADSADAGFARDMAVHHQQAVEMSFVVRDRTGDEEVRRLAYDIANTQANQRGMLLGWLDLWELPKVAPGGGKPMAWMASEHGEHSGHGASAGTEAPAETDGVLMPGMASRQELARLGSLSGERAEILFLQLMTDHHEGGVAMAEGCVSLCTVPAERRLARGMVEGQRSEMRLMRDMLAARGAEPRA